MSALNIPYEKQQDNVTCGAAALCMVYRALALDQKQADVWARVRCQDRSGNWGTRPHRLAVDALEHGMSALIFQAADPWTALEHCVRHAVPAILHHRLKPGSRQWHYSVLVNADAEGVMVHDPYFGPSLRISKTLWLEVWRPPVDGQERGHELVVIAPSNGKARPATCAACAKPVLLDLTEMFRGTEGPVWKVLYCPHCNSALNEAASASPIPPGAMATASAAASKAGAPIPPTATAASAATMPAAAPEPEVTAPPAAKRPPVIPKELAKFPEKFAPFVQFMEKLHEISPPSVARDQFGQMLSQLKDNTATFAASLDQMKQQHKAREEATARRVSKIQARVAKKQAATQAALARLAEKAASAPLPKPALPAPAPDPVLGKELRDSLLREFGLLAPAAPVGSVETESVQEMGSAAWQADAGRGITPPAPLPRPAPVKTPPPRMRPATTGQNPPSDVKDIGDGDDLSTMFGSP